MLSSPGNLKVFIAFDPCDMCAGINTLKALVSEKHRVRPGSVSIY